MNLYVLRHGEAVESPYYHDTQRPLTDLGKRQVLRTAQVLRREKKPVELILTSPLVRARETAEIVHQQIPSASVLTIEALVPGGNLRDLLAAINGHKAEALLMVGHEPQLSALISVLTAGDEHFRVEMKKSSLARLETPIPAKKGAAVLTWLLTAGQMEDMR